MNRATFSFDSLMHLWLLCCSLVALAVDPNVTLGQTNEMVLLDSWNDCPTKRALMEYVGRVIDPNHKDFVPVPERIAVFDNDGTLWPSEVSGEGFVGSFREHHNYTNDFATASTNCVT
jgi:hypothetical protein